jgi:hypothetical protein
VDRDNDVVGMFRRGLRQRRLWPDTRRNLLAAWRQALLRVRRRDSAPIARRLTRQAMIRMTRMVDRMRGVTALSAGKPLVGIRRRDTAPVAWRSFRQRIVGPAIREAADGNDHVKLWHGFLL